MTRPALVHVYPQWEPPEDDPTAPPEEWRETWRGSGRIVRNARRARLLRKRGVPLWDLRENGGHGGGSPRAWYWFTELEADHEIYSDNLLPVLGDDGDT